MSCQPEIHLSVLLGCACEDKGVFRHWVLDFENLGYRAGTIPADINDTVTTGHTIFAALVIMSQEFRHFTLPLLQSLRLLILVHLLPEMELLSSASAGDLVMFPGYDESLREDSRTNWRTSVRLSPGGGSHQDLDWRWYRGDNNYTNINQGEDYDGIHFGQFSVGSNQNHVPALDNLTQWYFCWWL